MEVMVVVVILGILSGIATVGWSKFSVKVKARGAMDDLRNAIQLARSDAITKRHHSGIVIDVGNLRYLRFVDSSSTNVQDGLYTEADDKLILQPWTDLPKTLDFQSITSAISLTAPVHKCDQPLSADTEIAQSGTYSIVFRPDGSSWSPLEAWIGVKGFSEKFHLFVLPSTGWVALEK